MTDKTEKFRECIELMHRDVAEFEAKYHGRGLLKRRMSALATARICYTIHRLKSNRKE